MNKADLVAHVAGRTELPKDTTGKAVDAIFAAITAALGRGEEIALHGFGSFLVAERPARSGRNPRTGETVEIAASRPRPNSRVTSRQIDTMPLKCSGAQ